MARIEELVDPSIISDAAPPPPSSAETPFPLRPKPTEQQHATTTPSLPPAMDSVRSHTADEIVQMMKKTPLFMTHLDDTADGRPTLFTSYSSFLHPSTSISRATMELQLTNTGS